MESLSLLAFGMGPMELGLVALVGLLLFGNRLPGMLRNLGRGYHEFRNGVQGIEHKVEEAGQ